MQSKMERERLILTDADGCLVHWNRAIKPFMALKGYRERSAHEDDFHLSLRYGIAPEEQWKLVKEFNESAWIETIESYADSLEYIRKLSEKGFRFIVVTSLSDKPQAKIYRTKNLHNLFGDVFDEIICLSQGKNKYEQLLRWKDSGLFWIEDHAGQAEAGHKAGLQSILINHPYNTYYEKNLFPKVDHEKPWEEIYKMVCKEYGLDE